MSGSYSQTLTIFLSSMLMQLPLLIVFMVGLVLVLSRWKQSPRAYGLAIAGLVVGIAGSVMGPLGQAFITAYMMDGPSASSKASLFTANALVWSFVRACSYGLLIIALLAKQRDPQMPPKGEEHWGGA